MNKKTRWKKTERERDYQEWVIPSSKGIFIGGNRYAEKTISIKRRGWGIYWDVYAITPNAEVVCLLEKGTKSQALRVARQYMKTHY